MPRQRNCFEGDFPTVSTFETTTVNCCSWKTKGLRRSLNKTLRMGPDPRWSPTSDSNGAGIERLASEAPAALLVGRDKAVRRCAGVGVSSGPSQVRGTLDRFLPRSFLGEVVGGLQTHPELGSGPAGRF